MLNIIFGKSKTFEVNSAETTYKVHYLGNVMTSHLKGAYSNLNSNQIDSQFISNDDEQNITSKQILISSIDKPVKVLWDNHLKHNGHAGIKMKLILTQGGLRVDTKDHGLTEYYGHRIYLVKSHPIHPKLLVWVYQHVGKNLKTEIRCHAALCQNIKHSKTIETLLNEKLRQTFREYKREKKRLQNSRLCNSKNGGLLQNQLGNRKRTFRNITHNYKPPVQHGMCSAPKLDDVLEEDEDEYEFNENKIKEVEMQEELVLEENEPDEGLRLVETDDFYFYDEDDEEFDCTATSIGSIDHEMYDNRPMTHQINLSSSSSSSSCSVSSDSLMPTPVLERNLYDECMPVNESILSKSSQPEVSYEFLADLSKSIEPKKLTHSKSFINKQQNFMNPFRRTNFSRSFTAFTSRFKNQQINQVSEISEMNEDEQIEKLKYLTLNSNESITTSMSSPTLSTSSSSTTSASSLSNNHRPSQAVIFL